MAPPPRKKAGKGKRRGDNDDEYSARTQSLQKPPDQEKLTDQELKEEFIRNLNTVDPLKAKNLARWDYVEKSFVPYADPDSIVVLFEMESELIGREGEEIKEITADLIDEISDKEVDETSAKDGGSKTKIGPLVPKLKKEEAGAGGGKEKEKEKDRKGSVEKGPEEGGEDEEKDDKDDPPAAEPSKPKKLLNQFNFCERASQTHNNRRREHSSQTEEPTRSQFRDTCNQWVIYDAYEADHGNRPQEAKHTELGDGAEAGGDDAEHAEKKEAKVKEMKKDKEGNKILEREKVKMRKQSILDGQAAVDASLLKSSEVLKYLERLAASNAYDDVLYDFKYFEDSSDDYREGGEGTLLPLWRFVYEKAKKKHVTCISWSVSQPDMFAVSYGSFSFIHPVANGLVVIYSLRNTNFPEHIWMGPKGALSCHVHPERNCLVCVGLVDGNVAVLNLEKDEDNETQSQVMKNIPIEIKHRAPVWSVKWAADDIDGNPIFFSAGMGGRVIQWTLDVPDLNGNGGLVGTPIATLTLPKSQVSGPDGTTIKLFGCARVIAFHPIEKTNFLVGTAEGKIFRTSSLYGGRVRQIYDAHFLPVAALQWNHYHFEVFVSCSEDWTIKVWDRREPSPMYVFEIGVPILDVCWAPYSSTVFGSVTGEGKVLIFDLNSSREKPVCTQQVVTKKKVHPHRIEFNPSHPIIVVGDDRGSLTTLKLSPNLRILPKDTRGIYLEGDAKINFEVNKMTKLLNLVRDPRIVTEPRKEELPLVTNLHEISGALSRNYN